MAFRCGHCGERHESVAMAKACAGQATGWTWPHGKPVQVTKPGPVTVGMYRKGGQIYRVDWTRHGHLFAKLATVGQDASGRTVVSYTGAPGMVARLTQADRMDIDEVAEFGRLTQTCMRCGIALENEASVKAGIGPICATKI